MNPLEPDPDVDPQPPERIGSYRIVGRLGQGGMGEVFEAEDPHLRRRVAIKCLRADTMSAKSASRLLTEARAVARLDHPNICAIHEVGESDGRPFIVMPLVEGETLAQKIAAGPLPLDQAVAIAQQVADALDAAHAQGVLHRDIKPSNIMIDARGNARVMDFGLAKLVGPDEGSGDETVSRLTQVGTTVGTAAYMSPEQARGEALDARSDLFSLGVVLYEMLSGVRPFKAGSLAETYTALLTTEPSPVATLRPDLPASLQHVVNRALRKAREERYQSATEMAADLTAIARQLRGESGAISAGTVPRDSATSSRRRLMVVAAAASVLLVIAAGFAVWRLRGPSSAPVVQRTTFTSLAVLPFVNAVASAEQEYLTDGITDSLIGGLSELRNLKVIARSSVFRFKGQSRDPRAIAKELGVEAVMTGVVRQQGDQLVIDVELSDAKDASVLLSHRYTEASSQVLAMESMMTRDVAEKLRLTLSGQEQARLSSTTAVSPEAYEQFLKGRFYGARSSPGAQHQAIEYFERAIALAPSYGPAYANLAQAHAVLGIYFESPRVEMPKAKAAAQQAMKLDANAIDARIVLGLVNLVYDWDWTAAAAAVTTSTGEIDPRALNVFSCAAHLLESAGRTGAAQHEVRRALSSDPLSVTLHGELGCTSYYRHQYDEALSSYREALALDDRDVISYWGLGRAFGQKKQYKEALESLMKVESLGEPAPPLVLAEMGYAFAKSGRGADARQILLRMNTLSRDMFVDSYLMATVYIGLGDVPHTLEYLEKAYDERSGFLVSLTEEPKWDELRSNQRFRDLVKKVGFI